MNIDNGNLDIRFKYVKIQQQQSNDHNHSAVSWIIKQLTIETTQDITIVFH